MALGWAATLTESHQLISNRRVNIYLCIEVEGFARDKFQIK